MMRTLAFLASLLYASAYRVVLTPKMAISPAQSFKAGVIAVITAGCLQTSPVIAANYGGFGSTSAEVVQPKDAVIDSELASTDDFKKGAEGLAKALQTVKSIKADFNKNNQIDVGGRVRAELPTATIRGDLNKYSAAFSEDTQKGSDRLIRRVIQGFTEIDRESQVKEGKTRSSAKISALEKRLSTIIEDLESLSQFKQ